MKKFLVLAVALMIALPNFAQKLTKEEKIAQQKALYETMVKALEVLIKYLELLQLLLLQVASVLSDSV